MATRASRKPTKEAVGSIAPMIVGTLNFCVATSLGAECGLTHLEAKLLIPSVQRTMERLPAAAASRAAVVIDPLVILTVLVMWAKRIATIKDTQAKERYAVQPAEQARANGVAGTAYTVPHSTPATQQQPVTSSSGVETIPAEATANGVPEEIRRSFANDDAI